MFLFLDSRHVCSPEKGTNNATPYKASANNARMKKSKDLILGDVVKISSIYPIPELFFYFIH